MDFKQIIKQEWQKEYLSAEGQEPYELEDSIFSIYHELVERICVKVWNQAVETCADNVEVICDSSDTFQSIDEQSILKLKIDEQGTNTAEI